MDKNILGLATIGAGALFVINKKMNKTKDEALEEQTQGDSGEINTREVAQKRNNTLRLSSATGSSSAPFGGKYGNTYIDASKGLPKVITPEWEKANAVTNKQFTAQGIRKPRRKAVLSAGQNAIINRKSIQRDRSGSKRFRKYTGQKTRVLPAGQVKSVRPQSRRVAPQIDPRTVRKVNKPIQQTTRNNVRFLSRSRNTSLRSSARVTKRITPSRSRYTPTKLSPFRARTTPLRRTGNPCPKGVPCGKSRFQRPSL